MVANSDSFGQTASHNDHERETGGPLVAVSEEIRAKRRINSIRIPLAVTGLYHSLRLLNGEVLKGAIPIEALDERINSFPLPSDLAGMTVLDVGPWDGYFTFEMERRGAQVTAIDYVDLDTFRAISHYTRSSAKYLRMDV